MSLSHPQHTTFVPVRRAERTGPNVRWGAKPSQRGRQRPLANTRFSRQPAPSLRGLRQLRRGSAGKPRGPSAIPAGGLSLDSPRNFSEMARPSAPLAGYASDARHRRDLGEWQSQVPVVLHIFFWPDPPKRRRVRRPDRVEQDVQSGGLNQPARTAYIGNAPRRTHDPRRRMIEHKVRAPRPASASESSNATDRPSCVAGRPQDRRSPCRRSDRMAARCSSTIARSLRCAYRGFRWTRCGVQVIVGSICSSIRFTSVVGGQLRSPSTDASTSTVCQPG